MATEGMKYINNGVNPFTLSEELLNTQKFVLEGLKSLTLPVTSKKLIQEVATISAQSEEIGKVIADTIDKVGENGVITVEEGKNLGITTEITIGYKFNQGYTSPYFVTDPNKMECIIDNAYVLITDKTISNPNDIQKTLNDITMTGSKDIVIIAEDVVGDALTMIVRAKNARSMPINIVVVKAPSYGDVKKEMLCDIAAITGGKVFSDDFGITFDQSSLEYMGRCDRFICTKQNSIIV
jgi:chaperonin GroEL